MFCVINFIFGFYLIAGRANPVPFEPLLDLNPIVIPFILFLMFIIGTAIKYLVLKLMIFKNTNNKRKD